MLYKKSVAFDFVPGGFDFVVGGFLVVAYIPCGGDFVPCYFVEHISSAGLRSPKISKSKASNAGLSEANI